jgi:YVTN family beta-propeller protein
VQYTQKRSRVRSVPRSVASLLAATCLVVGGVLLTSSAAPAFAAPRITGSGTGTLLVPATASPVALTSPTADSPYTSVITPDSRYIYTADQVTDQIYVVDSTTDSQVAQIAVTANSLIESSAISSDGLHAYFAGEASSSVMIVDTATNTFSGSFPVIGNPLSIALSPDNTLLYVVSPLGLTSYALPSGILQTTVPLGVSSSTSVVLTPDGTTAYVSDGGAAHDVNVVNTVTHTLGTPIVAGSDPFSLAISPDGSTVYVVNAGDDTLQAISTATNTIGSAITPGGVLATDVVRMSADGNFVYVSGGNGVIAVLPADLSQSVVVQDLGAKYDLVPSPDGKRIYAPNLTFGTLDIINVVSLTVTGPAKIVAGTATTSFNLSIDDGNTPVGDYSANALRVDILNSSSAVVATGSGTFDPTTGTATITVPTAALANGTYSIEAASDLQTGATVIAAASGFVIGSGLAPTGVDATVPLLLGGILVLAGLVALLLVRLARRRSRTEV